MIRIEIKQLKKCMELAGMDRITINFNGEVITILKAADGLHMYDSMRECDEATIALMLPSASADDIYLDIMRNMEVDIYELQCQTDYYRQLIKDTEERLIGLEIEYSAAKDYIEKLEDDMNTLKEKLKAHGEEIE